MIVKDTRRMKNVFKSFVWYLTALPLSYVSSFMLCIGVCIERVIRNGDVTWNPWNPWNPLDDVDDAYVMNKLDPEAERILYENLWELYDDKKEE